MKSEGSANPPGLLNVRSFSKIDCANFGVERGRQLGFGEYFRKCTWKSAALLSCFASILAWGQAPPPSPTAETSAAQTGVARGIDLLKQHQPQEALTAFEQAVSSEPENEQANLLAASAALDIYEGETAVKYAEKAKQLAPDDWRVNTTLVAAYAIAGHKQQRDAERLLLHKLHDDPHAVEAAQANGFLLEMFPAKKYRVDAIEYFHPMGKFHLYYRFLVRDAAGKRVWEFGLQSDDLNQASWAKVHPQEAAAGKRQFSLQGEGGGQHADYRLFSGDPDYDELRAEVVRIVESQPGPFPGETTAK
jgi:tetratricopeptide (TPR) repeat protein